mgnify:FL=1|jgi:hypothetical protein
MSVARITTLNFKEKSGADQIEETYKTNAPTEFAEAEQLLEVRVDDTTLMFVSLYADNDAMERASAARTKRMDLNKDLIESMEGKTGEVILNHK